MHRGDGAGPAVRDQQRNAVGHLDREARSSGRAQDDVCVGGRLRHDRRRVARRSTTRAPCTWRTRTSATASTRDRRRHARPTLRPATPSACRAASRASSRNARAYGRADGRRAPAGRRVAPRRNRREAVSSAHMSNIIGLGLDATDIDRIETSSSSTATASSIGSSPTAKSPTAPGATCRRFTLPAGSPPRKRR